MWIIYFIILLPIRIQIIKLITKIDRLQYSMLNDYYKFHVVKLEVNFIFIYCFINSISMIIFI